MPPTSAGAASSIVARGVRRTFGDVVAVDSIALEAPAALANAEIERVLAKVKEPLLTGFECFDVFRDPSGQKLAAEAERLIAKYDKK